MTLDFYTFVLSMFLISDIALCDCSYTWVISKYPQIPYHITLEKKIMSHAFTTILIRGSEWECGDQKNESIFLIVKIV